MIERRRSAFFELGIARVRRFKVVRSGRRQCKTTGTVTLSVESTRALGGLWIGEICENGNRAGRRASARSGNDAETHNDWLH